MKAFRACEGGSWHLPWWFLMHCKTLSLPQPSYSWEAAPSGSLVPWCLRFSPAHSFQHGWPCWSLKPLNGIPASENLCYFLSTLSAYSILLLLKCELFLFLKRFLFVDNFIYTHNIFSHSFKWHFCSNNTTFSERLPCLPLNPLGIIILCWLSIVCDLH